MLGAADDYQIAGFLIERGLGVIYLIGFAVAALQFPALSGERGLDPAPDFLRTARFSDAPSPVSELLPATRLQ